MIILYFKKWWLILLRKNWRDKPVCFNGPFCRGCWAVIILCMKHLDEVIIWSLGMGGDLIPQPAEGHCVCMFLWLVAALNDWSDPVWHKGSLWRKHLETHYWVMVDMQQEPRNPYVFFFCLCNIPGREHQRTIAWPSLCIPGVQRSNTAWTLFASFVPSSSQ